MYGDHDISLSERGKKHYHLKPYFNGTAVKMVLPTDRLGSLLKMLESYREDGFKIAKQIRSIGCVSTSSASLMLSRDFKGIKE